MAAGYDAKVWTAIRELWQVSDSSWQTILDQVSDLLACEVPSISAVAKRSKVEKWKKLPKKGLKKGVEKELKDSENFNPPDDEEKAIKTVASDENFNTEKTENSTPEDVKKVTGELVNFVPPKHARKIISEQENKSDDLVKRLRKQTENSIEIDGRCIEGLANLLDEVEALASYPDDEKAQAIVGQMVMYERIIFMANKVAVSRNYSVEHAMRLYGLETQELRDAKQALAQRTKVTELSDELRKKSEFGREDARR